MAHILIIQGHPDPEGGHFCHGLAQAYGRGAGAAGHVVRTLAPAQIDFPLLRSQAEQERGEVPPQIAEAQAMIREADHIVAIFPLWFGMMPALLKGFFEQVLRPDFSYRNGGNPLDRGLLKGRSMRIVMTMSMPGLWYRLVYGSHSLKAMKVGMFGFIGLKPIRASIVGRADAAEPELHKRWLAEMEKLGRDAR